MKQILKDICAGKYKNNPEETVKLPSIRAYQNKKDWYKIGKVILRKHKVAIYKEGAVTTRRTYRYYSVDKGNWEGPSPRKLGKMPKKEFDKILVERKQSGSGITFEQVQNYVNTYLQDWNPEEELEIDGTISFLREGTCSEVDFRSRDDDHVEVTQERDV